jgi:Rha family phage regulatory protein
MNPDLFPETLLVSREGEHIYTTSVLMAEHFHKRHDNVMKAIDRAIEDAPEAEQLLNFEELCETYTVRNGAKRQRRIYALTHDGFMFVAQGFTGKQAATWKWDFIAAFRAQERALAQLTARYAQALDVVRPCLRPVVQGTEQGLNRVAIGQPLGKSVGAITYHRRKARELGLLQSVH